MPLFYNPGHYVSGYFTISPHYSGGVRVAFKLPVMVTSASFHTLNIRESFSEVTSDNSLHFFSPLCKDKANNHSVVDIYPLCLHVASVS